MKTKRLIFIMATLFLVNTNVFAAVSEQRIRALENDVAELQMKELFNRIKLSATLDNRFDHIRNETQAVQDKEYNFLRLQFALNLSANISDKMTFYGRYTTSKFFNQYNPQNNTASDLRDFSMSHDFNSGPTTVLERAYFNYKFSEMTILSLGRLPTNNGPVRHWVEGVAREGTYSRMGFSANYDGIALKQYAVKNDSHEFSFLGLYTPWNDIFQDAEGNYITQRQPDDNANATGDKIGTSLHNVYAFIASYKHQGTSAYNNMQIMAQYLHQDLEPSNTFGFEIDYTSISLLLAFEDMFRKGLDLGVNYVTTISDSKGQGPGGGWLTDKTEDKKTGKSIIVSARYKINSQFLHKPYIGFEYIKGDKYFQFDEFTPKDLTNFYANRGKAYHFYWLQTFQELKVRVGYQIQENDYGTRFTSYWGEPRKQDNTIKNIYINARLDF